MVEVTWHRLACCSKPWSCAVPMSSLSLLGLWYFQLVVAPWHAGLRLSPVLWNPLSGVTESYHADCLPTRSLLFRNDAAFLYALPNQAPAWAPSAWWVEECCRMSLPSVLTHERGFCWGLQKLFILCLRRSAPRGCISSSRTCTVQQCWRLAEKVEVWSCSSESFWKCYGFTV